MTRRAADTVASWTREHAYPCAMTALDCGTSLAEGLRAADASSAIWRAHGEVPIVVTSDRMVDFGLTEELAVAVVLIPRLRHLECHVVIGAEMKMLSQALSYLVESRWNVCVLLPARCLGSAHEELRGLDIELQGWWNDGQGEVKFGSHEAA